MDLFAFKKSWWVSVLIATAISSSVLIPVVPIAVEAQATTASPGIGAQIFSALTTCDSAAKMLNPLCAARGFAVWGSSGIIYVTGWFLGIAGVLMNISIELTTLGFDSQIYANIQGGVEAVWTAFRDIANIIIIGMFTFIALTMILGIEKFNARQMVAKVLLIAVLINFSLLFTRVIIASSNFVAVQFYKAAQFGYEPAASAGAALAGQYSTGISGKFAQLMGVASFAETRDALWKISDNTLDPGFMTLAFGLFTAVIIAAAAFVFSYIAFLLIARALLFIFLLITSSLAFASYLIPGGGFAGYGWDAWWKSLLKNAVFAPLLLMLLWATIQVGTGIKAISGSGSLGGLLADPAKGGNINALFCYLLILGMLFVSIKIASKFSHEIGGFNYAALAASFGVGALGRVGGFLGRQTLGRLGTTRSSAWEGRVKDLANKPVPTRYDKFAKRMYEFGAAGAKQFGKRDYNFMGTQFGKEIGKVTGKDFAGKALGGFEATQKKFIEKQQELAKKQAYSDEERRKIVEKGIEAERNANATLGTRYSDAEGVHKTEKENADKVRKEAEVAQNAIIKKFESQITGLRKAAGDAQSAVDASDTPANQAALKKARGDLREAERARRSELNFEQERIKSAERSVNIARKEFLGIAEEIRAAAEKNGRIPEQFKKPEEIAKENIKSSYTAVLHANSPTPAGVDKLADKVAGQLGKDWSKDERRMTKNIVKQLTEKKMDREEK